MARWFQSTRHPKGLAMGELPEMVEGVFSK